MKISTHLSAGSGLLILLFVLCTGIAVHALRQATEGMNDTVDVKMKRFAVVVNMRNSMRDMAIAARNLALLSDPAQMQPEWPRMTAQREVYIQKRQQLEKSMSVNVSAQGKTLLEKSLSAEDAALSTLMAAGKLGLENRQQEATAFLMTTARPAQRVLLNTLDNLTDTEMQLSRDTGAENSARTARTAVILSGLAALSVLLSVGTCYLLVRMLMRQLGGEPAQAQALGPPPS
ncbi:MCP four helix bundle domain-containing protein, partial [Pantoea deleyi]|uniref:MCP four helix bundle domain-containing protein n=1 Tax=Pantoea deleyi TaxID=470932 RepID=UPI001B80828A